MGKREEVKKTRREKDYYGTIDPNAIVPKFISLEALRREYGAS